MPTALRLRTTLRWVHIAGGLFLGTLLYSPLYNNPFWAGMARAVVVPTVVLTGVWMWQQTRIRRMLGNRSIPSMDVIA